MGQIANQMAIEFFYKMKQIIKEKKENKRQQKEKKK